MFEDADGRGWLLNPSSLAELVTRSLKDAPADDSGNGAVAGVGYREDPGLLLSRESRSLCELLNTTADPLESLREPATRSLPALDRSIGAFDDRFSRPYQMLFVRLQRASSLWRPDLSGPLAPSAQNRS